jgi:hypothetical protein
MSSALDPHAAARAGDLALLRIYSDRGGNIDIRSVFLKIHRRVVLLVLTKETDSCSTYES